MNNPVIPKINSQTTVEFAIIFTSNVKGEGIKNFNVNIKKPKSAQSQSNRIKLDSKCFDLKSIQPIK
jgi:hypothetical protein